jgi:serine/threonine protein kinase
MAEIYLARLPGVGIEGFEKLVVIKRILPQHALDPELLRMFLDEARLMARLGHPNEYAQLARSIVENQMLNGETIRAGMLRSLVSGEKADAALPPVGVVLNNQDCSLRPLFHRKGVYCAGRGMQEGPSRRP